MLENNPGWALHLSGFTDAFNALSESESRIRAILRLVSNRLLDGEQLDAEEENDLALLLAECADGMTTGRGENFNALNKHAIGCAKAIEAEAAKVNTVRRILDATRAVARHHASCTELAAAAQSVFEIASADRCFEPDWRETKQLIAMRGLRVEVVALSNYPPRVEVTSAAVRQAKHKMQKAQGRFVRAVQRQSALAASPPPRN